VRKSLAKKKGIRYGADDGVIVGADICKLYHSRGADGFRQTRGGGK
jgi:hypothetical protein